jgi:hypothetical protein
MSITSAFEKIQSRLPQKIIAQVSEKLVANSDRNDVTVEGFGLYRLNNPKNVQQIVERRIRTKVAKNITIHQTLEGERAFLAKAMQTGTQDSLWDGYFIGDDNQWSFLVNLSTGEVFWGQMD